MTQEKINYYLGQIQDKALKCHEKVEKIRSRISDQDLEILFQYGFFDSQNFPEDPEYTATDLTLLGVTPNGRLLAKDIVQYVCDLNRELEPIKEKIRALQQLNITSTVLEGNNGS